jgi:hypothetical protein
MNPNLLIPILSALALIGSGVGAYIGVRVAIARIETWREITDANINRLTNRVDLLSEDCAVFNTELGWLMREAGRDRANRQELRR